MVALREDVHIHAEPAAIQRRILALDSYPDWLGPAFRAYTADGEGFAFHLAVPARTERARLRRAGIEDGAVTFVRDGDGAYESLTWALHAERAREVHVTLEATYRPAGGLAGAFLETLFHRPHRAQAFRDALWRLKHLLEAARASAARA
ncbi:MAG: hypothetical protein EXR64_01760 [Dehalococcoidia bacterium]|nr:hypothetical protein [Dehalococcoidia bacterium]